VAWGELLKVRRAAEGNPNWVPSWIERVRYQSVVYKILREQFDAARQRWQSLPIKKHPSEASERIH
jgi:hypothetical protein